MSLKSPVCDLLAHHRHRNGADVAALVGVSGDAALGDVEGGEVALLRAPCGKAAGGRRTQVQHGLAPLVAAADGQAADGLRLIACHLHGRVAAVLGGDGHCGGAGPALVRGGAVVSQLAVVPGVGGLAAVIGQVSGLLPAQGQGIDLAHGAGVVGAGVVVGGDAHLAGAVAAKGLVRKRRHRQGQRQSQRQQNAHALFHVVKPL